MSMYHYLQRGSTRGMGLIVILVAFGFFAWGCGKGESDQGQTQAATSSAPAETVNTQTAAEPMAEMSSMTATESTPDAGAMAEATGTVDGEKVYKSLCVTCHGSGIPNIPQVGNKEAWAPRIAQGTDVLHEHAIKGFTGTSGMPMMPKGGNLSLTDEEVKAAVDYMVSNSQ